jgi:hypothetical protein
VSDTETKDSLYPIENRLQGREGWAYLAQDNIDAVIERIVGIVRTDRLMTKITRYRYHDGTVSPDDLWAIGYDTKTSLHLDHDSEKRGGQPGVKVWSSEFRRQKGVTFRLMPGIESFGISVGEEHSIYCSEIDDFRGYVTDTEEQVAAYVKSEHRTESVTFVRWDGFLGERNNQHGDRIFIQDWNSAGVCIETLILFEAGTYTEPEDD